MQRLFYFLVCDARGLTFIAKKCNFLVAPLKMLLLLHFAQHQTRAHPPLIIRPFIYSSLFLPRRSNYALEPSTHAFLMRARKDVECARAC